LIADIKTSLLRWYPFMDKAEVLWIGEEDAVYAFLKEKFGGHIRRVSVHDGTDAGSKRSGAETEAMSERSNIRTEAGSEHSSSGTEAGSEQSNAGIHAPSVGIPAGPYDYVLSVAAPERLKDPASLLTELRSRLKPDGRLLLGMNNRLGIRYFCGDKDPYTGQCFDGTDDYFRAYRSPEDGFDGRCYDRQQLEELLEAAGISDHKFYSVFSDLENASFLFADGYLPNEELYIRIFPTYRSPETVFLEEERLYSGLLKNGLFHRMANAFLIECSPDGTHTDALQITNSFDRGRADAMITVIHENDTVTKQAAYPEGEARLERLAEHMETLKKRGVSVVDGKLENGIYTMPFIKTETGMQYLERIQKTDPQLFLQRLDEFRDEIVKSSEAHEGIYEFPEPKGETEEQRQKRLKKKKEPWETEPLLLMEEGFADMIPLNSFFIDGRFVFFDQEYCLKDYPLKAILCRVIVSAFTGIPQAERRLTEREVFGRYGIDPEDTERFRYLSDIAERWLKDLRNEDGLSGYHSRTRRDLGTVNTNRQRMNYPEEEYRRRFIDIFDNAGDRKLILFGSGNYARRFLAIYGRNYAVDAVIDNNESRWGQTLYPEGYEDGKKPGVVIRGPEYLKDLQPEEYKVIICIKSYASVMKQLDAMGIENYSIYDPARACPVKGRSLIRRAAEIPEKGNVPAEKKKYHTGYIAGVFDLYHIGHLNMFRRAKEMCDYLIVGVVSDEGVRHNKRTDPFVPFEERIEMVRSCRYVDEAVEIPYRFGGTEDAWRMYHFDVQFSGSDYANDPEFARYKEFLEKHGAAMEFFPYTESTSSTKLKGLIEKKLL